MNQMMKRVMVLVMLMTIVQMTINIPLKMNGDMVNLG